MGWSTAGLPAATTTASGGRTDSTPTSRLRCTLSASTSTCSTWTHASGCVAAAGPSAPGLRSPHTDEGPGSRCSRGPRVSLARPSGPATADVLLGGAGALFVAAVDEEVLHRPTGAVENAALRLHLVRGDVGRRDRRELDPRGSRLRDGDLDELTTRQLPDDARLDPVFVELLVVPLQRLAHPLGDEVGDRRRDDQSDTARPRHRV